MTDFADSPTSTPTRRSYLMAGPSRAGGRAAGGGRVAALGERATGKTPYLIGKPNPLMMRSAFRAIGAERTSDPLNAA